MELLRPFTTVFFALILMSNLSFAEETWTIYDINNSQLPSNKINCVEKDGSGNYWIGTDDAGLVKLTDDNIVIYSESNSSISSNRIMDIEIDASGNIWLATIGGGLCKFDGNTWYAYNTQNSDLPRNSINSVELLSDNKFYVGTGKGLAVFDGETWDIYNTSSGLPNNTVLNVTENAGYLWISTAGGIVKTDLQDWITYNSSNTNMPFDRVEQAVFDNDGTLWICVNTGTNGGLTSFDGNNWVTYQTSNSGLSHNVVKWVDVDPDNKKLIATYNGVSIFDEGDWSTYSTSNSDLPGNSVHHIFVESYEKIWFSTFEGGFAKLEIILLPDSPTNLSVSFEGNSIQLVWDESITENVTYNIYRSETTAEYGDAIAESINSATYTDNTGLESVVYFYVVKSEKNNVESENSNEVNISILSPPSNLQTTEVEEQRIYLTWDEVDGAVDYRLFRASSESESFFQIYRDTYSSFEDNGVHLEPNTTYQYKVKAENDDGLSSSSDVIEVTTDIIYPPTNVQLSQSNGHFTISWSESQTTEAKYNIYKKTNEGDFNNPLASNLEETSYIDEDIEEGIDYYYTLKSSKNGYESDYSGTVSGKIDYEKPDIPMNVELEVINESIKITWDENEIDGITYNIYRRTVDESYDEVIATEIEDTEYIDSDIEQNVFYYYSVTAVLNNLESEKSEEVNGRVLNTQTVEITIASITENSIELPKNATAYIYYYIQNNDNDVYYDESFHVKVMKYSDSNVDSLMCEGYFAEPGLFMVAIPGLQTESDFLNFKPRGVLNLGNIQLPIDDNVEAYQIRQIDEDYSQKFNIMAGRSIGLRALLGGVGGGASVAAAAISVSGESAMNLNMEFDGEENRIFGRRFDSKIQVGIESPAINLVASPIKINAGGELIISPVGLIGQKINFRDVDIAPNLKRAGEAAFVLETMSLGAIQMSPAMGLVYSALVNYIKDKSGIDEFFNEALAEDYEGVGLEGQLRTGFGIEAANLDLGILDGEIGGAVILEKGINYHNEHKVFKKINIASNYNLSGLNFGLKNDKYFISEVGFSNWFSFGGCGELQGEFQFKSGELTDILFSLKNGGNKDIWGYSFEEYQSLNFSIPPDYIDIIREGGYRLMGLYNSENKLFLDKLFYEADDIIKDVYSNLNEKPLYITTNQIINHAYAVDLAFDLDLVFGVGGGIHFGIKLGYFNELSYPKTKANVFLDGSNYITMSAIQTQQMSEIKLRNILNDVFIGAGTLVSEALLNVWNDVKENIEAGKDFVVNVTKKSGEILGTIRGNISESGEFILSFFDPATPRSIINSNGDYDVKNIYYSNHLYTFQSDEKGEKVLAKDTNSIMVAIGKTAHLSFIPEGDTTSVNIIDSPVELNMMIDSVALLELGFLEEDKNRIALYWWDSKEFTWEEVPSTSSGDTIIADVINMGDYALGIGIELEKDDVGPAISNVLPEESIVNSESFPIISATLTDNEFGVGVDFAKTEISINDEKQTVSLLPSENQVFCEFSQDSSIVESGFYTIKIVAFDNNGNQTIEEFTFEYVRTTDVENKKDNMLNLSIVPNPFEERTTISFTLKEAKRISLSIIDLQGNEVFKLLDNQMTDSGVHSIIFDSKELTAGVYLLALSYGEFTETLKMVVE